ncbi:MAG: sulfatase [Candidatus Latescibacteria bacterium]|nr:sulfatase [Candidatus Latescibacterota bacterium]
MNFIVICLDSFRQDHVSFYNQDNPPFDGVHACKTPNIDTFGQECVVFNNVYPCGMPTIPIRMELMTAQFTLPYRPWQPLAPTDITAAEILHKEGYVCGLISDTYHYRAPGMNYHRGFNAYHWIRGQEYDPYNSAPTRRNIDDYVNKSYSDLWRNRVAQFLANTDDFTEESHWFPAQVVEQACDWLTKNRSHKKIFCWIDSFDPHEPWDPPARFDIYTDQNYRGPRLVMPIGGPASTWASPEQIRHIRGLYAGETAFVDHCLGRLFECLKDNGYYEDSLIVLMADHGHPLGDHGKFLKGTDRMYSELLNVPFMIRLPDVAFSGAVRRRQTQALAQFPDVLPTLLDLMGFGNNIDSMHGRSFKPVVLGEKDTHRDAVICGYHEGVDRCIRDATWSYVQRPECEVDELYHLQDDPRETRNRIDDHKEEAIRLASRFGSYWRRQPTRFVKGVQEKYEVASGAVR